jgi:arginyl-tRNA synthetase
MKVILEQKIRAAVEALQAEGALPAFALPEIRVTQPKDEQFGEYTTNVALVLAKTVGKNPREIAGLIESRILNIESPTPQSRGLDSSPRAGEQERLLEKIEVAGPGHLNFYLSQSALADVCKAALEQGGAFGNSRIGKNEKVNNEFISANPTGPLHIGNGRGGIFGDVLARVLHKAGYDVTNEYYVNDAGEQVVKLGHSVLQDAEAVYAGDYIDELHKRLTTHDSQQGTDARVTGEEAADVVLDEYIKKTLREKLDIAFDIFTSERREIVEKGYVDKALEILKEKGFTYESEGALWLRTTDFSDDKDRVLVKSDRSRTYFASDCGYLLYKMDRDFTRLILTLGADHHGYKMRLLAAAQALGFAGKFDFVFVQLVKLMKDGEEVRMSKRAGNVVTIDELVEAVGADVTRFFFLMYAPDTHMNFDLGLAEERSQKNPVFYVQYAHARLASVLRKAEEEGFIGEEANLSLLVHPKERELMRELLFFPELIEEIADDYAVHKLPQYAIRLSDKLHSFYDACRVLDAENKALSLSRLELIKAVKVVLAETLHLMSITAPEKM